jgi:CheY-like chemotaxis protein
MPGMDGFTLAEQIKNKPGLNNATVMMLSSGGKHGDARRCRDLGIAAYLSKPIRQSDLFDAISEALGVSMAQSDAKLVTRHSLRERRRNLKVLLAEDNAVNQMLAVQILEKRGHKVTVVNNGKEAVDAVLGESYDVVLMDLQMPVMGGLEATATIRAHEAKSGGHIPIIAMTAHAMTGDREKCLASGMDGYISKPIRPKEFHAEVELITESLRAGQRTVGEIENGHAAEPAPSQAETPATDGDGLRQNSNGEPSASADGSVLDTKELLDRVDQDRELLRAMTRLFWEDWPDRRQRLQEAVDRRDAELLQRTAHEIKGSVGNFCANRAYQAALALEIMGTTAEMENAGPAVERLVTEIDRLHPVLEALEREDGS